jgi:hypothetical protein
MAGDVRSVIGPLLLLSTGMSLPSLVVSLSYSLRRYIMSMAVSDYTGQAWLQGFNDVGVIVFGMPADDLVQIRVNIIYCTLLPLLTKLL